MNKIELLPPGQYNSNGKWPVLTAGRSPQINGKEWKLSIDGLVENSVVLTYEELIKLNPINQISDFHCVTTWSLLQTNWTGIPWSTIETLVKPKSEAKYVLQHSCDDNQYTTGTSIEELREPNVLIGYEHEGQPIPTEHGGPLRMIIPQLYAYKSAKWLCRIEFLAQKKLGFWEVRGYSEQANPWKEQRYTEDDEI